MKVLHHLKAPSSKAVKQNSASTGNFAAKLYPLLGKLWKTGPKYAQYPHHPMLSKLFNSAKNLFKPTLPTDITIEPSIDIPNTEMVTTRGQFGKHVFEEVSGAGSVVADMPRSSRKRSVKTRDEYDGVTELVEKDEEAVTTPAKKQKVLPLREKDEDASNKNTRVVVEIPVSSIPVRFQEVLDGTESDKGEENAVGEAVRLEIADSEPDSGNATSEEPAESSPVLPKKQTNPTTSSKKSKTTTLTAQPQHKRFGSGEPELEPEFISTAKNFVELDEESSGDDAPEVVGAQDALKTARWKDRSAAKAVEEQGTAIRKKRQERDALLRKQAESSKRMGKRGEAAEGFHVAAEADEKPSIHPINRSSLPDLLPDEYLLDDPESEDSIELGTEVERKKPKKMKFADLVEKIPKDRRKGSATYRVSEFRSSSLAPKSSFHARTTKESWLKGRAGNGASGSRKVAPGGFFKKQIKK